MSECPNRKCVVYALFSSLDGEIRYIGQTTQPMIVRMRGHLHDCKGGRARRCAWMRSVIAMGGKVEYFVLRPNAVWAKDEIEVIAEYKRLGARLVNLTPGGDGQVEITKELRDKMVAGLREAYRLRGQEIGAKLSAARMGHGVSQETRAKLSASLAGRTFTAESRAAISAANTRRFSDPRQRQNISERTKEAMARPEVKRLMLQIAKERWSNLENRSAQAAKVSARFADPEERIAQARRRAMLNDEQVHEVRRLRRGGATLRALSEQFGLSLAAMSNLCSGKTFKHVAQS